MLGKWSLGILPRSLPISKKDSHTAKKIITLQEQTKELSKEQIQEQIAQVKHKIFQGEAAENFVVQVFSLVREAAWRVLQMRHYHVQILAGIALFKGAFAEMATGEGKTLTATLPVVMWSLHGKGVHVHTTNSYLAQRDFELMSPVYEYLGLTSGLLAQGDPPLIKRQAYECDITYGVGPEYGFDYMRDQLAVLHSARPKLGKTFLSSMHGHKPRSNFTMQRKLAFALIDEVDSVLLDEARSPLVISEGKTKSVTNPHIYLMANDIAQTLEENTDFQVNAAQRSIEIFSSAQPKIYENVPQNLTNPWSFYIRQALSAHHFFHKNVHYIVDEGKVVIVDEYTGRRFAERTWRDGLHQAIEAKENLSITEPSKSKARITRQRYFSLYQNIAGMTGTARGSEKEIWQFYRSPVIAIPPRKEVQRTVLPDQVFGSLESKWQAVVEKVKTVHHSGQPILIGTRTIHSSEDLALRLQNAGLKVTVLNAKQDEQEAEIIGQAGQKNAITIATNMAGRGTDIHLGPGVEELGGLFVLGTERHESRRVDNQLLGRCGRQGNVGTAQFFVSFGDDLIIQHLPSLHKKFANKKQLPTSYSKIFEKLQKRLDISYFEQRKKMFHFDHWVEEVLEMIG